MTGPAKTAKKSNGGIAFCDAAVAFSFLSLKQGEAQVAQEIV